MPQKIVELALAFSFECPDCGHENFAPSVLHEFSRAEQAEYEQEIGERPETGAWVTRPDQVSCAKCGAEFRAVSPGEQH